jgi:predicted transport protein
MNPRSDSQNGDVEIGLSNLEDLAYVMGLVRQSMEMQLGNGGAS